jgi:uridine phosphorylase
LRGRQPRDVHARRDLPERAAARVVAAVVTSFPNVPGTYAEPSLYTPADFLGWARRAGWQPGPLPVGVVFTFQPFITGFLVAHPERFVESHALAPSNARVFLTGDDDALVGVSCLNPGATTLVSQIENLMYLGDTRRFVTMGTAGALVPDLNIADTCVLTAAVRDDGISHHYLPPARYVEPPGTLTDELRAALHERAVAVTDRSTWTVPTPYRCTAAEMAEYVAEGVTIVEEEAAALFAVSRALGAESAAAVVVSDVARAGGFEVEWRDPVEPLLTVLEAAIAAIRSSYGRSRVEA